MSETDFPPLPQSQPEEAAEPALLLREFIRLYLFQRRRQAHEAGLSARARMLMLLCRHEPLTQSEYGRILGLEKSWVSRGVEQMVEEGLVSRTTSPDDRRCLLLRVTDKGRSQAGMLESCFNDQARGLLAQMSPEHRAGFVGGLEELIAILSAMKSGKAGGGGES